MLQYSRSRCQTRIDGIAAAGNGGQQGRSETNKRVVSVFDGSHSATRALELAANLSQPMPFLVLVAGKDGDDATRDCIAWLEQHHARAEVHRAMTPSQDTIVEFVKHSPPSALLINRDSQYISESLISRFVDEFDCPLILC